MRLSSSDMSTALSLLRPHVSAEEMGQVETRAQKLAGEGLDVAVSYIESRLQPFLQVSENSANGQH